MIKKKTLVYYFSISPSRFCAIALLSICCSAHNIQSGGGGQGNPDCYPFNNPDCSGIAQTAGCTNGIWAKNVGGYLFTGQSTSIVMLEQKKCQGNYGRPPGCKNSSKACAQRIYYSGLNCTQPSLAPSDSYQLGGGKTCSG